MLNFGLTSNGVCLALLVLATGDSTGFCFALSTCGVLERGRELTAFRFALKDTDPFSPWFLSFS